jgi:hypothetical protein
MTILPGTDYTLGITLTGDSVTASVNGVQKATYTYNSLLTVGNVGLYTTGSATFDDVLAQVL